MPTGRRGRIRAAWGAASTVAPVITIKADDTENVDPSLARQASLYHSPALSGTPTRRGSKTAGDMMLFGQFPCPAAPTPDVSMPADPADKLAVSPDQQSDSDDVKNSFFFDISRPAITATATLPTKYAAAANAAPIAQRTGTAATVILVAPINELEAADCDELRNHKPEVKSRHRRPAAMSCSLGDSPRSPDAAVTDPTKTAADVADAFSEAEVQFRGITSAMPARRHATRRRPGAGLSTTLAAARRAAATSAAKRGSRTPSPVGRVPRKSQPMPMAVRTLEPALQHQAPAPPGPVAAADCSQTYVVVHSYTAKFADELTLSAAGQVVQVLERPTVGGWWRGRSDDVVGEGWFPANHVRSVPRMQPTTNDSAFAAAHPDQRVVGVPWSTRPTESSGSISASAGAEAGPTAIRRLRGADRRSANSNSSQQRQSLSSLSSLLGSIPPPPTIAAPPVFAPAPAPAFDPIAPLAGFATPSVAVPVEIVIAPSTPAVVSATPTAAAGGDTLDALLVSLRKSKAGRQHGKPRAPTSVRMRYRASAAVSPPAPLGEDLSAGDAARWDLYKATSARQDAAFEALYTRTTEIARRAKMAADRRVAGLEIDLKRIVDRGRSSHIGGAAPPSPSHTKCQRLRPEDQSWMDIGSGGTLLRRRKALPNLPRPGSVRWSPRKTGVCGVRTAVSASSQLSSVPQSMDASMHATHGINFHCPHPHHEAMRRCRLQGWAAPAQRKRRVSFR